jgi:hypothetical protein
VPGELAHDNEAISIKGTGCRFGGCVRKAVELTSGDLLFVLESRLRVERSVLTGRLPEYLKQRWPAIREQLLSGTYKPQPVKRVEIPKPDGGMRKLGIPAVLDRFIQQAVMQVLQCRRGSLRCPSRSFSSFSS